MLIGMMRDHAALSASAAHPAFNMPESARPPAALSTPLLRSLESAAFLAGVEAYALFKIVDKPHVPECFKTPPLPLPPKRFLDNPKCPDGWHNGASRTAGLFARVRTRERATALVLCGEETQHARLPRTRAALRGLLLALQR